MRPALLLAALLWLLLRRTELGRAIRAVARGHPEQVVRMVWRMLDRAEYKRRQAPPGVKLRPKAFGRDRRTPITNRWRG